MVLHANLQEYRPVKAHKTLKLLTWPAIETISVDEDLYYVVKDLRLPHLEFIMADRPTREFQLALDKTHFFNDSDHAESSYVIEVELACPQIATVFRKSLTDSFKLDAADVNEILAQAGGSLLTIECTLALEESNRELPGYSATRSSTVPHRIVFIPDSDLIAIDAVDKPRLLIGPWLSQIELSVSGMTLDLLSTGEFFKQVKCALTFID